jgi:hypothetical protein
VTQQEREREKVKLYVQNLELVDKDIKTLTLIKAHITGLILSNNVSAYNEVCLQQIRDKITDLEGELQEVFYNLVKRGGRKSV